MCTHDYAKYLIYSKLNTRYPKWNYLKANLRRFQRDYNNRFMLEGFCSLNSLHFNFQAGATWR